MFAIVLACAALAPVLGRPPLDRFSLGGRGSPGADHLSVVRWTPDLNASPECHLMLLPHVGPVRARAIEENRTRDGPFRALADLVRVKGIGPGTIDRLTGFARVEPSRPCRPEPVLAATGSTAGDRFGRSCSKSRRDPPAEGLP